MDIRKLAVATAIVGASLGAGFSLASAQTEAPSTTTPPSTEAPAQEGEDGTPRAEGDRRNCDKDGDGVPDHQQGEGSSATETGFFRS